MTRDQGQGAHERQQAGMETVLLLATPAVQLLGWGCTKDVISNQRLLNIPRLSPPTLRAEKEATGQRGCSVTHHSHVPAEPPLVPRRLEWFCSPRGSSSLHPDVAGPTCCRLPLGLWVARGAGPVGQAPKARSSLILSLHGHACMCAHTFSYHITCTPTYPSTHIHCCPHSHAIYMKSPNHEFS